ncbi:ATP-binding protein [Thalassococcus lentus]|uniref:histidine kinase n=1 Tax=Thalassococcus lentus TaxID=1210524 RepID=A0ABT4XQR1_9RHOB|nr:ATP-binding protein [Thalassococcus lentus]MDA7424278.1 ATP-binding protein [Thalassococcus lentus]
MTDLAQMVEAIPLPALVIGADERITAVNREACNFLGSGLTGRHFITALRQPDLLDSIEASLRDGAPRSAQYLGNEGGEDTSFDVSVRPVTTKGRAGVLVCFIDTTPMERAGQIRRDFVANVSHELRTPLTALLGFIETLKGPASNDAAARDRFLGIMRNEAERMNRLVSDLLSLSRVESEARIRPTDPVDLAALIQAAEHALAPLANDAQVSVTLDLANPVQRVCGDEDQLRQVITNLLENAVKYSGKGAHVTVSLGAPDYEPKLRNKGVRLAVRDTGPGIASLHVPRLTERFYRVDGHRSREKGGTGLGLAIVKHIVERHRGRIEIQSDPGQGSCFTVLLPLE